MDQVDMADQIISEDLARAIAAARGISVKRWSGNASVKKCIECNDLIPVKRRRAIPGCTRCVYCEQDYERYSSTKRRKRVENDALDDIIDDFYLPNVKN